MSSSRQEAAAAELLILAQRIREILSSFPPDDPSVLALKASPMYQQMAYLIEEVDPHTLH